MPLCCSNEELQILKGHSKSCEYLIKLAEREEATRHESGRRGSLRDQDLPTHTSVLQAAFLNNRVEAPCEKDLPLFTVITPLFEGQSCKLSAHETCYNAKYGSKEVCCTTFASTIRAVKKGLPARLRTLGECGVQLAQ